MSYVNENVLEKMIIVELDNVCGREWWNIDKVKDNDWGIEIEM